MKILLITTLPNRVATVLHSSLGKNLHIVDISKVENKYSTIWKIIHTFTPNTLITYRCPYILPTDILNAIPHGAYNIHPSLLPKYRGMNPWNEIFANHETKSGITLHKITREVDSGTIIAQRTFTIIPSDTLDIARERADRLAAVMVRDFIKKRC